MAAHPPERTRDKLAEHWRTLGLMSGAPACVIKAAYLFQIAIHHPDRGGTVADAQRVNAAYAELQGQGAKANEHVASFYDGEPWHVLGVASNADRALVERAGRALSADLQTHPRLAARVDWAIANFGKPAKTGVPRPRPATPPPRPRASERPAAPRPPATPGRPDGLVDSVDLGTVEWGSTVTREIRLTWKQFAPYNINVDVDAPIDARIRVSKALPGRFVIAVAIDWQSDAFSGGPRLRGHTLNIPLTVRWPGGGEAIVRIKGVVLYPAVVTASPESLDLGSVVLRQPAKTQLVLISTGAATVDITSSAWLARVDAAGKPIETPLRLAANTPVRVAFAVQWPPIVDRAQSVPPGKPVRPTGKITVRWNDQRIDVPVEIVVQRPRR